MRMINSNATSFLWDCMDVAEECFLGQGALHVCAVQARGMTLS